MRAETAPFRRPPGTRGGARAARRIAERRAQRLDTEARTLAKLLHVDTKSLWPAVIDDLTVEKGYEAALGAALGDDLEAPVDPTAPDALGRRRDRPADPTLPEGVEPLGNRVRRPRSWRGGWPRSA